MWLLRSIYGFRVRFQYPQSAPVVTMHEWLDRPKPEAMEARFFQAGTDDRAGGLDVDDF